MSHEPANPAKPGQSTATNSAYGVGPRNKMAVDVPRLVCPEPACRGNIVATLRSSDASYASRKPHKTDNLDAGGRTLRP